MPKILLIICLFNPFQILAQKEDLTQVWNAKWIMPQNAPAKEYAVHHFRKTFELEEIPEKLIIHSSGDNRYQLFVNEQMLTWGPLRGDLRHWHYESTDMAPYLKKGKNVIAAVVLNYGSHPPDAQLSVQTGFLLAADDKQHRFLNTNQQWKAIHNPAYTPSLVDKSQVNGYYGAGSKELVDGNQYIWDWQKIDYNDKAWENAFVIENAYAKTCRWASRWKLSPRNLAQEVLKPERFKTVRIKENIQIPKNFPAQNARWSIPPHTKGSFILDRGYLTTAYPVITLSKGKNARIKFTYVEAPYIGNPKQKEKGNRNEVKDKNFIGVFDQFIADGGENRIFKPLWWRAFRYVKVEIETQEETLDVDDISLIHSAYPFEQKANLSFPNQENIVNTQLINQVIEIGDRTMKACAHEHFMDCPYYEESQFEGDTRVEALVSYYNYGDPALGKQAIEQFSWSINDEGFLSARYPTNSLYYIPNFSIYWIGMLYDYMMLYDDPKFIQAKLPVSRVIMDYFADNERTNGTLERLDYHQFIDWSFKAGEPPFNNQGYSAMVDLNYLLALQWAKALEESFGNEYYANLYTMKADRLKQSIKKLYWNEGIGLFTDIPNEVNKLSQHSNCLAIITGLVKGDKAQQIMNKVLQQENLTQATLYWQFYKFEALHQSGLGDEYLNLLDAWEAVIHLGVTTWPETGPNSRSECHAWGSSPNYHLLKILAGIQSDSPGFKKIKIAPYLGKLNAINVDFPHHLGFIKMNLQKENKMLQGEVELPEGTQGTFLWNGNEIPLKSGKQRIKLR